MKSLLDQICDKKKIELDNDKKKCSYQTLEKLILECKKILKKEFKIKKIFILIEKPNIAKKYNCRSVSVSQ